MRRRLLALSFASALVFSNAVGAAAAAVPAYIGKHAATAQDRAAIGRVIADFQLAIKNKDVKLLSTLVLHSNIPFSAPASPDTIGKVRAKYDVSFDGIRGGGFTEFCRFIFDAKEQMEEKFYNVNITQDGHVAWVMFDYEFISNGKTSNYGVESWQMTQNAEGRWKIASVMWTANYLD